MSFNTVKSLILNLGLFQGDNNIRRNLSAFALNYLAAGNNRVERGEQDLAPAGNVTYNSNGVDSSVTVLRTSVPVWVSYVLKPIPNSTVRPSPVTVDTYVSKLLVVDDNVGEVTIANLGLSVASIFFVQG